VDVTTALDDFLNSIGVLSVSAASAKVAPHMVLGSFNGSGSDFTSHFYVLLRNISFIYLTIIFYYLEMKK
jgi:hypothetical protein